MISAAFLTAAESVGKSAIVEKHDAAGTPVISGTVAE
jgi:hypothetical protein